MTNIFYCCSCGVLYYVSQQSVSETFIIEFFALFERCRRRAQSSHIQRLPPLSFPCGWLRRRESIDLIVGWQSDRSVTISKSRIREQTNERTNGDWAGRKFSINGSMMKRRRRLGEAILSTLLKGSLPHPLRSGVGVWWWCCSLSRMFFCSLAQCHIDYYSFL